MKQIEVVAAIIHKKDKIFATLRGYDKWKATTGKRNPIQTNLNNIEKERARLEGKAGWEFPGGKIEVGETPEEALKREISEELSAEIGIDKLFCSIEYDYPDFHLKMHCYICSLLTEELQLNEHEAAKWLPKDELDSIEWLPADWEVIKLITRKNKYRKKV